MERLPEMLALRERENLAWLRAIPLALIAVMVPLDLFTETVQLWAVIAAMPPLAALVNGPRVTAVVALVSVAACMALEQLRHPAPAGTHSELVTVIIIGAVSVLIAVLRDRMLARVLSLDSVAEAAQLALLPQLPQRIGRLECAAVYHAAAADSRLGGDFYDLLETPWGVRAVLGDVSGHGLAAMATTSALLGSFREGALDDIDLHTLGVRLERRMALRSRDDTDRIEEFATTLLMAFAPDGSSVEIRSFGHHRPLLMRGAEVMAVELDASPPLGLVGEGQVESTPVGKPLLPGDIVVAYTDGLVEARDRSEAMYPLEQRLRERIGNGGPLGGPARVVEFLIKDVRERGFRITDDAAVLAVGALPG